MARRLLVLQMGSVFNLADRLHYVDSAGTFAGRDFCLPDGRIQIRGQVNISCHPVPLTDVRGVDGLDQVYWLQLTPCAMVDTLLPQVVGSAKTAYVHVYILLIYDERITMKISDRRRDQPQSAIRVSESPWPDERTLMAAVRLH